MPRINKPIAENIDENYIETYLTKQGFKRSDDEAGIPIVDFVNKLLVSGKRNKMIHESSS